MYLYLYFSSSPVEILETPKINGNGSSSAEKIPQNKKSVENETKKEIKTNGELRNEKPIPREKLPDNLKENDNYVEVLAAEIFSPHKFFVQLSTKHSEFKSMMEALE